MQLQKCGLCLTENLIEFKSIQQKIDRKISLQVYYQCSLCDLVSKSSLNYLTRDEELKRYQTHNNDLQQPGYRDHLNRLWSPLKTYIPLASKGLDYGSGPTPAFAELMRSEGYEVSIWDPFFSPDKSVFKTYYDFVTCVEVIEHCVSPHVEITNMLSLLSPQGVLAIGTWQFTKDKDFLSWGYRLDPTHISLFTPKSFDWCRTNWNLELLYSTDKVVIFKRK